MTRLSLASALATLYVLASAATARAECAWVLWTYSFDTRSGASSYDVDSAQATRQECDEAVQGAAAVLKEKGYKVSGGFRGAYEAIGTQGTVKLRYFCLPDTVDPRGPKTR